MRQHVEFWFIGPLRIQPHQLVQKPCDNRFDVPSVCFLVKNLGLKNIAGEVGQAYPTVPVTVRNEFKKYKRSRLQDEAEVFPKKAVRMMNQVPRLDWRNVEALNVQ